jgi:hypothetical protein
MAQFLAFEEGVEVNGKTVLSVVDGMPSFFEDRAREVLADNGIEDPHPDEWYPQQRWLDTFAEIEDRIGESTLREIGRAIPRNAEWPPDVDDLVGGLRSIDEAYHMNHRGGDIGHYHAEDLGNGTVEVTCRNPYPCAFDEGIVDATAREFSGEEVPQVSERSDTCRSDDGDVCTYHVEWW